MSTTWTRSLRVLSLALCIALALGPVTQAQAFAATTTGNLQGRVTITFADEPVAGVDVRVVNMSTAAVVAEATTAADGRVSFSDLPAGTYHLAATAPRGYVAAGTPLVTVTEGATASVDIGLVQQSPEWFDYALKDTVARVDGNVLVTETCGRRIATDENTTWLADLVSVNAIEQALGSDANVCLAYEGVQQDDGSFMATAIFAQTCTDELAEAFDRDSECVGGVAPLAALLAGLLGGTALAVGIIELLKDRDRTEVVTQ